MSAVDEGPIAPEGTARLSALRFRIFKRGSWRRAFRLEDVFWEALERAARDEQLKLGDYVKQLADSSAPDANISSLMRVRAMEWLNRRCEMLEAAQAPARLLPAVMAAPVPCFVISASRELVASNAEFTGYVTAQAKPDAAAQSTKVHMSLDMPVQKLLEKLSEAPGRTVACGFSIRTPAALLLGRARLSLLHAERRDMLVGYVLDEGRAAARL